MTAAVRYRLVESAPANRCLPDTPVTMYDRGSATALVEEEDEQIALGDERIVVVGHSVEPVEEQPGDVADRLGPFEFDRGLLAHR